MAAHVVCVVVAGTARGHRRRGTSSPGEAARPAGRRRGRRRRFITTDCILEDAHRWSQRDAGLCAAPDLTGQQRLPGGLEGRNGCGVDVNASRFVCVALFSLGVCCSIGVRLSSALALLFLPHVCCLSAPCAYIVYVFDVSALSSGVRVPVVYIVCYPCLSLSFNCSMLCSRAVRKKNMEMRNFRRSLLKLILAKMCVQDSHVFLFVNRNRKVFMVDCRKACLYIWCLLYVCCYVKAT